MGTPSLQLLSEQLLMRKSDRIYQKRSSTTKDTRKNPQGEGKEGQWGWYSQDSYYRKSSFKRKGYSEASLPQSPKTRK